MFVCWHWCSWRCFSTVAAAPILSAHQPVGVTRIIVVTGSITRQIIIMAVIITGTVAVGGIKCTIPTSDTPTRRIIGAQSPEPGLSASFRIRVAPRNIGFATKPGSFQCQHQFNSSFGKELVLIFYLLFFYTL